MVRKEEPLQMRIGEAKQRDIGKKRARVGPKAMDFLKTEPGDVIEIMGSRTSCAVVWPADEDEKFPDIIRIDGQTRKNVGGTLNDIVKVRKVFSKIGKTSKFAEKLDFVSKLAEIQFFSYSSLFFVVFSGGRRRQ